MVSIIWLYDFTKMVITLNLDPKFSSTLLFHSECLFKHEENVGAGWRKRTYLMVYAKAEEKY